MSYWQPPPRECGWCRPPMPSEENGLHGRALIQCSCWAAGKPNPCNVPRCPAAIADDTPIGCYRLEATG